MRLRTSMRTLFSVALSVTFCGASFVAAGASSPATHLGTHSSDIPVPAGYSLLASPQGTIAGYAGPGKKKVRNVSPTYNGSPLTMPVIAQSQGYLEVRLPMRPNGQTTWVKAANVSTTATAYRIVIDLKTTHLSIYYKNVRTYYFPVGVGSVADPTPIGNFFVAFFASPPNAGYGPFVMVTTAHSNTITDWEQSGDAMIAIHGPIGADAQIGTKGARISHGCIRMHVPNQRHIQNIPTGTPIQILPYH
jgi:lipoprotein-anchoring transpeptidase ErfK/SrfK